MFNSSNYYYKGYDIDNVNCLEKLAMEYNNPYGYNLESNLRRVVDYENKFKKTNQDKIKRQKK